jgi:hypothetical protein
VEIIDNNMPASHASYIIRKHDLIHSLV